MRTKVTLVLVLLNVALFFFIFKFERAWRTADELQEARRRVLGAETAEIRTLTVTSGGGDGPSYTLVRNRVGWTLTSPLDWPANDYAVRPIINALQFLTNETSFPVADLSKSGQTLADFGLEKPRLTVTFGPSDGSDASAAGPSTVLRLGDPAKVGSLQYLLSPDGTRIHVVSRSLYDALAVPLDQLRADTLFSLQVFEAKALSVQTGGVRVRIAQRERTGWTFDTIVNARASKTDMDLTINGLNALHVASFPSVPPAVLPAAAPTLRVTLEGAGRSETLLLGEPVKAGETIASDKQETEYFGQLMNGNTVRPPVFTVKIDNKLLQILRQAQIDLRERRILVDFDATAVTSITLTAPDRPPLTLQRLETNASDNAWQLVRDASSGGGPQTQPADRAVVNRLLDRLTLLSAVRFESDAPTSVQTESWGFNRPERQITIATGGSAGSASRELVQLGTDTAGAVYARIGSEPATPVYAVNVDLVADFPVDPLAWRDRTLWDVTAPGRLTAIKVTDLNTHQVVYETTLDADGKPEKAPRDQAGFAKLIAGLRTLRAKHFVQEGIPDRLMLASDERTWRYQLDVSVGLPGTNAEQVSTRTLLLTERVGGAQQLAGSKELNVVFGLEQPVLDALWSLTYGERDPGAPVEKK